MLAAYLALDRKHAKIQINDYFGAIYLTSRDGLVGFWKESAMLDAFARTACDLGHPPWFYWIEFHHALKKKTYGDGMLMPYSKELASIFLHATRLAHEASRATKAKAEVRVEHFVISVAAHKQVEFARRLVTSGLDLKKLHKTIGRNGAKQMTLSTPLSE